MRRALECLFEISPPLSVMMGVFWITASLLRTTHLTTFTIALHMLFTERASLLDSHDTHDYTRFPLYMIYGVFGYCLQYMREHLILYPCSLRDEMNSIMLSMSLFVAW